MVRKKLSDENNSLEILLTMTKTWFCLLISDQENKQKSPKICHKKTTNLTNNTNPLKLSTPLPMQGGLGVGLLVTPSLHPLHPPKQGARPVFIGVSHPYTLKRENSYIANKIPRTKCREHYTVKIFPSGRSGGGLFLKTLQPGFQFEQHLDVILERGTHAPAV